VSTVPKTDDIRSNVWIELSFESKINIAAPFLQAVSINLGFRSSTHELTKTSHSADRNVIAACIAS